jgi:stearoyl-CoA desaturase (delta-9 desaturase)
LEATGLITTLMIKATTVGFLILPPLAILTVAAFALTPSWPILALAAFLYVFSLAGVTVGFHRLLTHNGFTASPALRYALTAAGSTSWQGSPTGWVAIHRKHHQFSDLEGDPHSPHSQDRLGMFGVAAGFWYAHAGWLFKEEQADIARYAPDVAKDPVVQSVEKTWWAYALLTLLIIPASFGFLLDGLAGMATAVLWAGIIRVGFAHHVTWSTNSVCHLWGAQPFRSRDESRNVAWLAPFSLGESFHNAHHAYPTSPRHGLLPGQWDPSAQMIRLFERAGWATNVKWMSPEQILKRKTVRIENLEC